MTVDTGAGIPGIPVGVETHYEVSRFLHAEAELLDERRFTEWLALLTDDVRYCMPVRVTTMQGQPGAERVMDHFDEDRYTLGKRVERLTGRHAWTEDPPSRTRRFVTNVRAVVLAGAGAGDGAGTAAGAGAGDGELAVRSYLLLFRSRLDVRPPEWMAAERHDVLRRVAGGFRLASREIVLDESVVRTQNLAVFL